MTEEAKTFGWDDEISKESNFVLFEEGSYPFKVTNFERSVYQPKPGYQNKVPAGCNMAILTLEFSNPATGDTNTLSERLFLYEGGEGRISQFFISIGQKKKGEPVRPNWQAVLGSTGQADLKVENYTDKDGNSGKSNKVKKFLEPTQQNVAPGYQAPQQNYQQPPAQNQASQQNVTPFPQQQTAAPQSGAGYNF